MGIATNFDISPPPSNSSIAPSNSLTTPHLFLETDVCKLWHKQDTTFKLPKGRVGVILTSPIAYKSPKNAVLTKLFITLFSDSLTELAYDAELAGIHKSIGQTSYGIDITVKGYHHKLADFLETILERMISLKIDPERFEASKDRLVRSYRSYKVSEPITLASYAMDRQLV